MDSDSLKLLEDLLAGPWRMTWALRCGGPHCNASFSAAYGVAVHPHSTTQKMLRMVRRKEGRKGGASFHVSSIGETVCLLEAA